MAKIAWKKRLLIYNRDNFKCRYCGISVNTESATVDHILPVSKLGSDNPANLATSCKKCNANKSSSISFPKDIIERKSTLPRWSVHRNFGGFSIQFSKYELCLFAGLEDVLCSTNCFDFDLIENLGCRIFKTNKPEYSIENFTRAVACLRQFVVNANGVNGEAR